MSIPLYVLAGFDRRNLRSNESSFKYFLVGSFASAILLYGIALIYGVTGALDFESIRNGFPPGNPLGTIGLALVIVGFAFKVASVPFHQWAPDVYEGAPTSVTAFMAITVKVAAFMALLRLLTQAFGPVAAGLTDLFWVLAAATIVIGNVMAVIQNNLKRLLAYSSIAHAGYLLIGFATGSIESYGAVLFYLLVYVFTNLGAFAVLVALSEAGHDCDSFDDLAGLARQRPGLAALLTIFALSLAGIPGTAGFVAKFVLFKAAVASGETVLAIIGVLGSVVSVYYYLRLPVVMYMTEAKSQAPRREASTGELLTLAFCVAVVLFLGFFPSHAPGSVRRHPRAGVGTPVGRAAALTERILSGTLRAAAAARPSRRSSTDRATARTPSAAPATRRRRSRTTPCRGCGPSSPPPAGRSPRSGNPGASRRRPTAR